MAADWVKVGLEAHDASAKGGNILVYQGPDGDTAAAAYVACRSIATAFSNTGTFRDARPYKEAIQIPL